MNNPKPRHLLISFCWAFIAFFVFSQRFPTPAAAQFPITDFPAQGFAWNLNSVDGVNSIAVKDSVLLTGGRSKDFKSIEINCVDITDGSINWAIKFPRLAEWWRDNGASGLRSDLVIKNDFVVLYSNRGEVVCLDICGQSNGNDGIKDKSEEDHNADIVWKYDLSAELGVFKKSVAGFGSPWPCPIIIGDRVYCATGNADAHGLPANVVDTLKSFPVPAPNAPSCVCLNLNDGSLIWSQNTPSKSVKHASIASPVKIVHEQKSLLFLVGGDGKAYGISEADGKIAWTLSDQFLWSWCAPVVDHKHVYVCNSPPPGSGVGPSEIVCYSQKGLILNEEEATPKWVYRNSSYSGTWVPAVVSHEILFVITSDVGRLLAIDVSTGQELWRDDLDCSVMDFASMKVIDNILMVPADGGCRSYRIGRRKKVIEQVAWNSFLTSGIESTPRLLILPSIHRVSAAKKEELFPNTFAE